ncbi:hypothetical protein VEHSUH05_03410 [Veillonella denticariosi JCM 15641]|uniref:Uncharacterized protein n=1 Tax=Veillonella denticariosi JCM 15641 TaxID=1298594 RepID=A0A2S7ZA89_9FIRM|nr:hypothetical protein [Veillonella denticariosi]PQL20129.1 hypothetical protein VEHSUH05_03410 [Veillonella denticariosi JCM 15641]
MNAGRVLSSILIGMYAIYIIRNNTITIAGANTKRSLVLTMIQLGQLLMIELMIIFGGTILHSFSIFSLILAGLLWGEMFALKQNLNEYFMRKEGKCYGISIIGIGRIVVSVGQSIFLILLGIWSW